jgi:hypothetical protein
MVDGYNWPHDAIQRELDNIVAEKHDNSYDMTRIGDTPLYRYVGIYTDT